MVAIGLVGACATAVPGEAPRETGAPESTDTAPGGPVLRPGDRYVALGSSFAAGPGLDPIADEPCRRSAANYAAQVAQALQLDLTDVSCSATTTDNVLTKPHDTGDDQRSPQIQAVDASARLVTLTIGGNDIGYATLLDDYACLDNGTCPDITVDRDASEAALGRVTEQLVGTIEAVRERAPDALVLLVGYPQILPPSGEPCSAVPLSAEHARFVREVGARLQEAFVAAAERTGIRLVDSYSASAEHSACAASQPWVGGWIRNPEYRGPRAFHPTAEGMRAQADLIVAAISGK